MFYPVESLKRGGRFYLCWLADSWPERFAAITQRQLWSQDIRKICDDLLKVMTNESGRPVNRFSLRLSSQLMRGIARLYQRKVSIYLADLCMTNASIFKHINKKGQITQVMVTEHALPPPLPILEQPQIPPEEPENEQRVAELIQNSGNIVSNIQDITLKESVIPDFQLPPNDGFGEEHPDQALQLAVDRTIETMLRADVSAAQLSALSAALDTTEHERSRPPMDVQMEAAAEMDITLLRKSMGQDLLAAGDFEKEIPDIPEIPIPEMPVPVPQAAKQTPKHPANESEQTETNDVPGVEIPTEKAPNTLPEIELEELEELPIKRRRKNKLIIDKSIKIPANVLHARIENNRVELRCEDVADDVIELRLPVELYFRRPAHAGCKVKSNVANELTRLFMRNLGVVPNQQAFEREMEVPRVQRSLRQLDRSVLERIEEETIVHDKTHSGGQPIEQTKDATYIVDLPMDITKDVTDQLMPTERPVQVELDIADLPTQKLETASQAGKRKSEADTSPQKRLRSSDYVSFRKSQQSALAAQIPVPEAEKENIPMNQQSPIKSPEKSQRKVLSLLEQAGLVDIAEARLADTVPELMLSQDRTARKNGSEGSETPLGSLDRTKVSLGESDKTTDSIRLIRDQWGTVGTMTKIMETIKYGPQHPITVWYLMTKGPVMQNYKHIIAARCFTSILKLKHHGFIIVRKDPESLEIRDIILGPKFD